MGPRGAGARVVFQMSQTRDPPLQNTLNKLVESNELAYNLAA